MGGGCAPSNAGFSLVWDSGRGGFQSGSLQTGSLGQLCLLKPLAARAVKQNLVLLGVPNGGEFRHPRPVQTKMDPAGRSAPNEDPLGHLKRAELKLVLIANDGVNVFSKSMYGVDVLE